MANIAPAVVVLSNATIKIGANNYDNACNKVQFTPTTPKVKYKGIGGGQAVAAGTTDWMLDLEFAQDYATASALSLYLLANVGTVVTADFYPKAAGTGYRASILVEPGALGGDVDALLTAGVSLMVQGQPTVISA